MSKYRREKNRAGWEREIVLNKRIIQTCLKFGGEGETKGRECNGSYWKLTVIFYRCLIENDPFSIFGHNGRVDNAMDMITNDDEFDSRKNSGFFLGRGFFKSCLILTFLFVCLSGFFLFSLTFDVIKNIKKMQRNKVNREEKKRKKDQNS